MVKINTSQHHEDTAKKLHDLFKLRSDIQEIDEVLIKKQRGYGFDRYKAEELISKHNRSDIVVAAFNSPLKPEWIPFEQATDEAVYRNLVAIRDLLFIELTEQGTDEGLD